MEFPFRLQMSIFLFTEPMYTTFNILIGLNFSSPVSPKRARWVHENEKKSKCLLVICGFRQIRRHPFSEYWGPFKVVKEGGKQLYGLSEARLPILQLELCNLYQVRRKGACNHTQSNSLFKPRLKSSEILQTIFCKLFHLGTHLHKLS